jgi:hypothetical protein
MANTLTGARSNQTATTTIITVEYIFNAEDIPTGELFSAHGSGIGTVHSLYVNGEQWFNYNFSVGSDSLGDTILTISGLTPNTSYSINCVLGIDGFTEQIADSFTITTQPLMPEVENVINLGSITGRGIASVSKTATNGLIDTYTIGYTDNSKSSFFITNGGQTYVAGDGMTLEQNPDTGIYTISTHIEDNLNSSASNAALSANQGRVLDEKINELSDALSNLVNGDEVQF